VNRWLLGRIALVCALLNVGGGACAGGCCQSEEVARYQRAQAVAEMNAVDTFEFRRPLAEVWPELVGVLKENGYTLDQSTPVEGRTLETAFKAWTGTAGGEYRFLVRVTRVDTSRWRLSLEKQYRALVDGSAVLEIEGHDVAGNERTSIGWALIERTEPARAAEIQKRITEKAERAGASGRGCDRGCAACASLIPESR
jgi:hypothetical protein